MSTNFQTHRPLRLSGSQASHLALVGIDLNVSKPAQRQAQAEARKNNVLLASASRKNQMHQTLFLTLLTSLGLQASLPAQTNTLPDFQGFHPGDVVQVQVRQPLIVLGQALFQSQTPTNIAVISRGERYVLDKSTVVLSLPHNLAKFVATAAPSTGLQTTSGPNSSLGSQETQLLLVGVQQKILDNFSGEKGFKEATKYYQDTVRGYLDGRITLSNIVAQAEDILKNVDAYQVERSHSPQYEGQIRYLRDFVERAKKGETVQSSDKVE